MTDTTKGDFEVERPLLNSVLRGAQAKCPSCGQGRLFTGFLKVADECEACGEALHHHRADDLPAYLNILIVGHLLVGLSIFLLTILGMWATVIVICTLALALCLAFMRPLKGMVVGMQWAMRLHGFGGDHD